MKFKTALLIVSILFLQVELYADGCNNGAFSTIQNCNTPLQVCFNPGGTSDQPPDTQYTWDWGDGTTTTYCCTANNTCHTFPATGNYTVTLTLDVDLGWWGGGHKICVSSAVVPVTVTPPPVLTITDPPGVCPPGTIDITAPSVTAGSTGGGTLTYWMDAGATIPCVNPSAITSAGTYYINATIPEGCNDIQPVVVAFYPIPVLNITDPPAVCSPGTVDITTASVTAGTTGTGIFSYWTDIAATIPLGSPSAVATGGTYYIKITTSAGCTDIKPVTITIKPLPPSNAGPDITICTGTTGNIGTAPTAGYTYSWAATTGLNDATVSDPTVTLTNAGTGPTTTTYVVITTDNGCFTSDDVTVTVNPMPSADAGLDQIICANTSAVLAGVLGGAAISGTWSGGAGTFNPNATALTASYTPNAAEIIAGSVTLTLTTDDPSGPCPSVNDQMLITINPFAVVDAGPDQVICNGNTVTLAGIVSGSATSGTWTGGAGTYNPNNTTANAVYTPTLTEANGGAVTLTFTTDDPAGPCPAVNDQMLITINQIPTANAGSEQYVCSGTVIILGGSIGGTATSGTWSGGNGTFSPNNTTLNASYTASTAEFAAGSVELTLTTNDPAGPCSSSSSNVTLHFYQNPVVDFFVDFPAGCPIHCVNFTNLSSVAGGDTIASWNWSFGDGSPNSNIQDPSHCFSESGSYDIKLIATSNHGCTTFLNNPLMIHVFYVPVAEFNPTPIHATVLEPTVTFNNQSSTDVNYWHWTFGDGDTMAPHTSSPIHIYPNISSSSYWVTLIVSNADGCLDTVQHEIFIGPEFTFFIPNAFSPNADGINDFFFGSGIGIIKYDLWVFDRWGNMIFHGNELNDKWDGKANNGSDIAQMDVYVWKVELTDVFNKKHNYIGTVTLVK